MTSAPLPRQGASGQTTTVLMVAEQLRRSVPGGIGTYIRGLAKGLRESIPYDVRVEYLASGHLPELEPFFRPRITRLPSPLLTRLWEHELIRAPSGPDVVHATSLAFPSARRGNKPPTHSSTQLLTMFLHDLAWRRFPEAYPASGREWHDRALQRAIRHVDRFFVPSTQTAEDLQQAGVAADRISVTGEGADHLDYVERAPAADPFFLSVSTLEPRKNLARLVEGYASMRAESIGLGLTAPNLKIVGPSGWSGEGSPIGDTTELPDHLPVGVQLIGQVSESELARLYSSALTFVYVPLFEGFGLPPLEAQAAGTPVICSNSVPSIQAGALIVDPLNSEDIAQAMLRALTNPAELGTLAEEGLRQAKTQTWASVAAQHLKVWRS